MRQTVRLRRRPSMGPRRRGAARRDRRVAGSEPEEARGAHPVKDLVLSRLLGEELRRYEQALGPEATPAEQRKALHTLKGSAGLAGEQALADTLMRLERRTLEGDEAAVAEARSVVAAARAALDAGLPLPGAT